MNLIQNNTIQINTVNFTWGKQYKLSVSHASDQSLTEKLDQKVLEA